MTTPTPTTDRLAAARLYLALAREALADGEIAECRVYLNAVLAVLDGEQPE